MVPKDTLKIGQTLVLWTKKPTKQSIANYSNIIQMVKPLVIPMMLMVT